MTDRTRSGAGATATICVVSEGSTVDLGVTFGPATTVGQLADELTRRNPGEWADGLWIDGSQFASDRYLVDTPFTDGTVISANQPAPEPPAIGQMVAVAGWDAGRQVRLRAGSYPAGAVASESVTVDRNGLQVAARRRFRTVQHSARRVRVVLENRGWRDGLVGPPRQVWRP